MSRLVERGLRRDVTFTGSPESRFSTLQQWIVREIIPLVGEIRRILNAHCGDVVTVSGDHTVRDTERIFLLETDDGAFDVQLPPADGIMRELVFRKTDASVNNATILPDGDELIDGASSATVSNASPILRLLSTDEGWVSV